jgi:alpha-L-rhamnosidase
MIKKLLPFGQAQARLPFLLFLLTCTLPTRALRVEHLRVQSLQNPQGVDNKSPLFSWQLLSDERGVEQTAYQLTLTSDIEGQSVVWESGRLTSSASVGVTAKNLTLSPSTRYFWHVTVWDNKGNEATSTETAYFDTGLMMTGRNPLTPAIWLQAPEESTMGDLPGHYTIDFDMYLVKGRASIIFAWTASDTYHMWQINCLDYDKPAVKRHVYSGGTSSNSVGTISQFQKSYLTGQLRHYRIEVNDKVIRTFIENTLVDTYTDNSGRSLSGDIGMRVYGTTEEAYFDNILVSAIGGDGQTSTILSEDFESPSLVFYNATVENKQGSQMCHMQSASGENKVMQSQTAGAPMFRKAFNLQKPVRQAKLYTSGLGIYDVFINGQRVGHLEPDGRIIYEELKPGWTDYRSRVFYSSHDVTTLLAEGANAIGAVVTSGWWSGAIARGIYGNAPLGFIAKLIVTYEDGTQETLVSDLSWRTSRNGAVRQGDIYDGEIYDARLESAWTTAGFDDSQWTAAEANNNAPTRVDAFTGGYVQQLTDKVQSLKRATIYNKSKASGTDYGTINIASTPSSAPFSLTKDQAVILDFGQNIVGWVRLKVRGKSGNRLHMRFAEMLNDTGEKSRGNDGPGGSLYLANLRTAKAECFYTLSGNPDGEAYHPTTTFYGFRYCEIAPTDDVEILSCEAQPISSSTEETGTLSTSNPLVNQLVSNIQWGQRGNLLSVPTDCPQRDERLGWSGDTQVFCLTAMYNADTESFFRKWLQDMRDSQRSDGAYSTVAPQTNSRIGAAAWSDAGILVPWRVYLMYGDKKVLEENFPAMEKYMDWLATQTDGSYQYAGGTTVYGDWLSYADTDARLIAVAYYAYDALLMSKIARAMSPLPIGTYARKAAAYEALYKNIREEFRSRYLSSNLLYASQTALLLALKFGLYEGEAEEADFKNRLAKAIKDNNYTLNTGFVGTGILGQTLSEFGLTDYAYDLLLQRNCPSWLYSVDQGATTIWERWNSYTRESGFGPASMNSFNHYAYGAVGEWMYRYMSGIQPDESSPGFHHFLLKPQPDRRTYLPSGQSLITSASATYQSRYGTIASAWTAPDANSLAYTCTVPANTTATLYLPAPSSEAVMYESGKPASAAQGVTPIGYEDGCLIYELQSGTYQFSTDAPNGVQEARGKEREGDAIFDLGGRYLGEAKSKGQEAGSWGARNSSRFHGIYITNSGKKTLVK